MPEPTLLAVSYGDRGDVVSLLVKYDARIPVEHARLIHGGMCGAIRAREERGEPFDRALQAAMRAIRAHGYAAVIESREPLAVVLAVTDAG